MTGVKGRSGGARANTENNGGNKNAGRKKKPTGDLLVKVIAAVLPDTLTTLRAVGAATRKGKEARHTAFGASLVNGWASARIDSTEQGRTPGDLPAPRAARRVQITLWISKPAAQKIYSKSLDKNSSRSAVAGEILDLWAVRARAEAEQRVMGTGGAA